MKLRSSFLVVIVLLGITSAFGFKPAKKQSGVIQCTFIYNNSCVPDFTDQDDCSQLNTGAVCTTTNGLGVFTAYYRVAPPYGTPCATILRQP